MPETSNTTEQAPGGPVGSGRLRACGLGAFVLCLGGAVALAVVSSNAGAALDARVAQAEDDLDALKERTAGRRATILGQPDNDENALRYYNGIEWVLAGGKPAKRWRGQRPELPEDIDEVLAAIAPQGTLQADELRPLQRGVFPNQPLVGMSPTEAEERAKAERLYAQYKPLLGYLRRALSRGRCDWEVEYERGPAYSAPSLSAQHQILLLMIHEAAQQSPSQAVQTGLELLALSQDLRRMQDHTGASLAAWATTNGLQSLAHTLSRPGLRVADCRRVLNALEKLPAPHVESFAEAESLAWEIWGLSANGRPLQQSPPDMLEGQPPENLAYDYLCLRELEAYREFMTRSLELARLPLAERRAPLQEERRLQSKSSLQFVAGATFLAQAQVYMDELLGMTRALGVLAAARLLQLEGKPLPARIEELSGLLGKSLVDPCSDPSGAPLKYALEGRTIRAWSVGTDSVDEGGPQPFVAGEALKEINDHGFILRIPSE